ncbi:MAG: hypothetical protein U1E10_11375, partial [Bdellovibrionales bacterium]|nr:hypothetical protein [Bdellovibrionales bacterium]
MSDMFQSARLLAIFFSTVVAIVVGSFAASEARAQSCKSWSTDCKSIQALRESQTHKHIGTSTYRCETSLSHFGSVGLSGIDAAKKILQSAEVSGG